MFYFNETMPDCVPEYYRAHQEEEDHRQELRMQAQAHYLANRAKIAAAATAGFPILDFGGYGSCWECQSADHDTQTAADDDFCRVICCNPACPQHERH